MFGKSSSKKKQVPSFADSGSKSSSEKQLISTVIFPEIQRELEENQGFLGNLKGLFVISIFLKGEKKDEWFLLFQGQDAKPVIARTRPDTDNTQSSQSQPKAEQKELAPLRVILIDIDDRDIYNFVTGGLPGIKAFQSKRIRIAGDLLLAQQLQEVFLKAGGVEKARQFLKRAQNQKSIKKSKL